MFLFNNPTDFILALIKIANLFDEDDCLKGISFSREEPSWFCYKARSRWYEMSSFGFLDILFSLQTTFRAKMKL
jgi:hypothetical protein